MRWVLDVAAIVAVAWWQRARVWPALRLVTGLAGCGSPGRGPRPGVIAVLVSRADMEARVRWALGWRADLRFAKTWADLERVIGEAPPLAVFADPLADGTGDAMGHLTRLRRERGVPVVLYTTLTPITAKQLLALGQLGIRYLIFHQLDDGLERFNAVVDWGRVPPSDEPPLAA